METIRICNKCFEGKSIDKFAKLGKRNGKQRIRNLCLNCDSSRLREKYWKNAEESRKKCNLKKNKYIMKGSRKKNGWTEELYLETFKKQNNRCALCGSDKPAKSGKNDWHADHDHQTGKARGILCIGCNTLLGRIEKNGKEWIEKAENYVSFYKQI